MSNETDGKIKELIAVTNALVDFVSDMSVHDDYNTYYDNGGEERIYYKSDEFRGKIHAVVVALKAVSQEG